MHATTHTLRKNTQISAGRSLKGTHNFEVEDFFVLLNEAPGLLIQWFIGCKVHENMTSTISKSSSFMLSTCSTNFHQLYMGPLVWYPPRISGTATDQNARVEQRMAWPQTAPPRVAEFIRSVQEAAEKRQLLAILTGLRRAGYE